MGWTAEGGSLSRYTTWDNWFWNPRLVKSIISKRKCRQFILYLLIIFDHLSQQWAWNTFIKGNWRVHNRSEVITTRKCSNHFKNDAKKWILLSILIISFDQ